MRCLQSSEAEDDKGHEQYERRGIWREAGATNDCRWIDEPRQTRSECHGPNEDDDDGRECHDADAQRAVEANARLFAQVASNERLAIISISPVN